MPAGVTDAMGPFDGHGSPPRRICADPFLTGSARGHPSTGATTGGGTVRATAELVTAVTVSDVTDPLPTRLDATLAYAAAHLHDLPERSWTQLLLAGTDPRLPNLRTALLSSRRTTPREALTLAAPLLNTPTGPGRRHTQHLQQIRALVLRDDIPLPDRLPYLLASPSLNEELAETSTEPQLLSWLLDGCHPNVAIRLAANSATPDEDALLALEQASAGIVSFTPTAEAGERLRALTSTWVLSAWITTPTTGPAGPARAAQADRDSSGLHQAIRTWGLLPHAWPAALPAILDLARRRHIDEASSSWLASVLHRLRAVVPSLSQEQATTLGMLLDGSGVTHEYLPAAVWVGLPSTVPPPLDYVDSFSHHLAGHPYLNASAEAALAALSELGTLAALPDNAIPWDSLVTLATDLDALDTQEPLGELLVRAGALHAPIPSPT